MGAGPTVSSCTRERAPAAPSAFATPRPDPAESGGGEHRWLAGPASCRAARTRPSTSAGAAAAPAAAAARGRSGRAAADRGSAGSRTPASRPRSKHSAPLSASRCERASDGGPRGAAPPCECRIPGSGSTSPPQPPRVPEEIFGGLRAAGAPAFRPPFRRDWIAFDSPANAVGPPGLGAIRAHIRPAPPRRASGLQVPAASASRAQGREAPLSRRVRSALARVWTAAAAAAAAAAARAAASSSTPDADSPAGRLPR
uniref:translation initiation factor IF-2-like n=1 Tax=Jaculus jaculus TaxID=51337 RepID=UPI001E1B11B7|nr:translation initiation factor IF-2-like [Jaculus jaculus]